MTLNIANGMIQSMNIKVLLASGITVLSLTIIATTFVSASQPKQTAIEPQVQVVEVAKTEEVVATPTVTEESPVVQQTVQETVIAVPTSAELIVQYNWTGLSAVTHIITSYEAMWPEYFNDANRERSFAYIDQVGRILTQNLSGEQVVYSPSILYIFDKMVSVNGTSGTPTSANAWAEAGQRAGVSY